MPRSLAAYILMLATAVLLLGGAAAGPAVDEKHVEYFAGSCVTSIPDSHLFIESGFLLERRTDPQAGTITERMLLIDRQGVYSEHCQVLQVSGCGFRLELAECGAAALGSLAGREWRWNFISYSLDTPEGLHVDCDASLDGLGLYRETLIKDEAGRVLVYMDETASPLTAAQYGEMLTHLAERTPLISRS